MEGIVDKLLHSTIYDSLSNPQKRSTSVTSTTVASTGSTSSTANTGSSGSDPGTVSLANPNAGPVSIKVAANQPTDYEYTKPTVPAINLYQCGEWHGVYSQPQIYGKLAGEADKELYDYYKCASLGAAPKKPTSDMSTILIIGLLVLGAGGIFYI